MTDDAEAFERFRIKAARLSMQNSVFVDQLINHCAKRAALLALAAAGSTGLPHPFVLLFPLMDSLRLRFLFFVPSAGENAASEDWLDGTDESDFAEYIPNDGCGVTVAIAFAERLFGCCGFRFDDKT